MLKNLPIKFLCLCSAAMPVIGHAQVADTPAAAEPGPTAQPAGEGLEEIVVTAQKRSENLQKVPITITALSATRLQASGISDIQQVQQLVPGLKATSTVMGAQPFLRGVGYGSSFPGLESPTTLMIDEVYSPSPAATLFALNSIQQIEVLKGPQGTLFGRNAVAGAISLRTRNPGDRPALDADVQYGNYDTWTGRLYASTPIAEGVSGNVSLMYQNQGDGWGRNLFTGSDFRKARTFDGRAKLLIEPADGTSILLAGWYSEMRSSIPATITRQGTVAWGGYVNADSFFDGHVQDQLSTSQQGGVSVKVQHDLGFADLVDIASFQKLKAYFASDNDGTAADPRLGTGGFLTVVDWKDQTVTNELRLASHSGGPLTWVAGIYALWEKTDPVNLRANNAVIPTVTSSQKTTSYAPFGQATLEVVKDTHLTLGLRYNYDKRELASPSLPGNKQQAFRKMTWRVALDHQLLPNVLLYASFNRGYHAGAYSLSSPAVPVLQPEVLDAYEAGFKSELFDRKLRLNASAFYYDYSNVILKAYPAPGAGGSTGGAVLSNAANAHIKGVDIDFEILPVRGLSISGGVEFLDAKFTDWPNAAVTIHNESGPLAGQNSTVRLNNGAGFYLTNAPKFSGNIGVTYGFATEIGDISLGTQFSYRGVTYWDPGNRLSEGAVPLLNASIGWTSTSKRWTVQAFGQNLTDKHYFAQFADTAQGDVGTVGAPRTYGIRLGVHL